jgi:hypothetical protein
MGTTVAGAFPAAPSSCPPRSPGSDKINYVKSHVLYLLDLARQRHLSTGSRSNHWVRGAMLAQVGLGTCPPSLQVGLEPRPYPLPAT